MAAWKFPLMAVMTLSSLGAQGILSYIGFHRKQPLAGVLYTSSIVIMFGMAGMASGEQSAAQQWIEEGANSLGRLSFAVASYLLDRRLTPIDSPA